MTRKKIQWNWANIVSVDISRLLRTHRNQTAAAQLVTLTFAIALAGLSIKVLHGHATHIHDPNGSGH